VPGRARDRRSKTCSFFYFGEIILSKIIKTFVNSKASKLNFYACFDVVLVK